MPQELAWTLAAAAVCVLLCIFQFCCDVDSVAAARHSFIGGIPRRPSAALVGAAASAEPDAAAADDDSIEYHV